MLFSAAIGINWGFTAGSPVRIAGGFRPGDSARSYSPTRDGVGFVALPVLELDSGFTRLNLALGWRREVTRLFEARR